MPRLASFVGPAGAALLGGVVGGLLVAFIKPAAPKAKALAVEQEPAGESAALATRLALLEQQVAAQRLRSPRLVPQAGPQTPAPPGAPTTGGEPGAGEAPAVVDDPVFEAAVRDILQRVDEERDSERELRSDERRREAAQSWTNDFATRAGLNEDQKTKVLSVLQDFMGGLRDQRNTDAGVPRSRQEWRARSRELREQAEQRLSQILSRDQLDVYNKLEEEQRIGGVTRQGRRRAGRE